MLDLLFGKYFKSTFLSHFVLLCTDFSAASRLAALLPCGLFKNAWPPETGGEETTDDFLAATVRGLRGDNTF